MRHANLNPLWYEKKAGISRALTDTTPIPVGFRVEVYDHDSIGKHDFLGQLEIKFADLKSDIKERIEDFNLAGRPGKSDKEKDRGNVTMSIHFYNKTYSDQRREQYRLEAEQKAAAEAAREAELSKDFADLKGAWLM
jgi:hypothetical protein